MRKITIYLGDYVDDSRRRERRRGTIVAIGAVLVALFAAGAFDPAAPQEKTDTTDTTQTTDTTETTGTAQTIDTTATTTTTIAPAPARIFVEPGGLGFLRQFPGSRSDRSLVTVRNDGDEPLTITNVRLDGAGFEVVANDCAAPLPRGGTCSVALVFAPQTPGLYAARLVVESNGGAGGIQLNGFTIPPVDLGTIDFGRQMVGRQVPPRTVRFTNQSAVPVNVTIRSIAPEDSPFAVVGEPCGAVAPGGGCDVTIVFTPRAGESTAALQILDANQALLGFARLTGSGVLQDGPFTFNPALIQTPAKRP